MDLRSAIRQPILFSVHDREKIVIPRNGEKSRFIQITQASLTESHPHDILITNPGKNY